MRPASCIALVILFATSLADAPRHLFFVGHNKTGTTTLFEMTKAVGMDAKHGRDKWGQKVNNPALREGYLKITRPTSYGDGSDPDIEWLSSRFPSSAFVLNTRDLEGWLSSRHAHVANNQDKARRGGSSNWLGNSPCDVVDWIISRDRLHSKILALFAGATQPRFSTVNIPKDGTDATYLRLLPVFEHVMPGRRLGPSGPPGGGGDNTTNPGVPEVPRSIKVLHSKPMVKNNKGFTSKFLHGSKRRVAALLEEMGFSEGERRSSILLGCGEDDVVAAAGRGAGPWEEHPCLAASAQNETFTRLEAIHGKMCAEERSKKAVAPPVRFRRRGREGWQAARSWVRGGGGGKARKAAAPWVRGSGGGGGGGGGGGKARKAAAPWVRGGGGGGGGGGGKARKAAAPWVRGGGGGGGGGGGRKARQAAAPRVLGRPSRGGRAWWEEG